MTRFFFHVFNGHGHIGDEEGQELADETAARVVAIDSIRSMVSEDARRGFIDLCGCIAVKDAAGNVLFTLHYADAFALQLAAAKDASGDD